MNTENVIPNGYQIFEDRLEVAGISHRLANALPFARSKKKWIEFQQEPDNKHDKNAIKVIGCTKSLFGTKKRFLGYIPKEVSKKVVENGYFQKVIPRLADTFIGDGGYIGVYFQILGPKGEKYYYDPPKTEEGGHYTEYVERVKQLRGENRNEEAKQLLLKLIDDVEKESKKKSWGVAPWYYEQLAIIYRKDKRYDEEVQILERYFEQDQAPGSGPDKLSNRLKKAKQLRDE